MTRRFVTAMMIPLAAGMTVMLSTAAWSDSYCSRYASRMAQGVLYAVPVSCSGAQCLKRVNGQALRGAHRFLYRTNAAATPNSLIVLQRRYKKDGAMPAKNVLVRREKVPFACSGSYQGPIPDVEGPEDDPGTFSSLNYRNYDRYNRSAAGGNKAAEFLRNKFHFLYDNGNDRRCVSTRDPERRKWFLFERQDAIRSGAGGFLARLGVGPSSAEAASAQFSELRLNVKPYQTKTGGNVCVSFAIDNSFDQVEIGLYDIEGLVAGDRQMRARPTTGWVVKFAH